MTDAAGAALPRLFHFAQISVASTLHDLREFVKSFAVVITHKSALLLAKTVGVRSITREKPEIMGNYHGFCLRNLWPLLTILLEYAA